MQAPELDPCQVAIGIALLGLMIGVSKGGYFGLGNELPYIEYPSHP
jgi:hypothetical protein